MQNQKHFSLTLTIAMLFLPTLGWAHTGYTGSNALISGFSHPFTGFDHLFTLFALSLLTLRHQPKDRYLLAVLFLTGMGLGFALSTKINSLIFVEEVIALSVVTFGIMLLFRGNLRNPATLTLIVLFASAHGYAHGIEVSGNSAHVLAGLLASCSLIILITVLAFRQNSSGRSRIRNAFGLS